ncbi:hypothetical protein ABPG77_005565 [Micractinium sp. CCAP 211/92]
MKSVDSVQQLVDELDAHKEGLVVVEFFGTWCSSCKALLPHLIKLAEGDDDTHWLLVDYDENKPLGRGLGVKGLPCILIFDGAQGCVEWLEVTASRLGELTEALNRHRQTTSTRPAGPFQIPPLPAFPTVHPRRPQASKQQQLSAAPAAAVAQQAANTLSNVVELPGTLAPEAMSADCS